MISINSLELFLLSVFAWYWIVVESYYYTLNYHRMLNQKLKAVCNFLLSSKKTTHTLPDFTQPCSGEKYAKKSTRLIYQRGVKNNATTDKLTATENDWWIN